MPENFLESLNPDQKKAVLYTDGPSIILAGAGSGKTRVLTYKVTYLICEKHIPADNILMVTFTNKAANEMRERIIKMMEQKGAIKSFKMPYAGTFHSLSAKILRHDGRSIGIPIDFIIYDEQDQKEAVKEAMIRAGIDDKQFKASSFAINIQQAKNELISAEKYPEFAYTYFQKKSAEVYREYQKILLENHALDFEDLLFYTVLLLRSNKKLADYYKDKFRYILVDEYQDTNHAQYQFTKILSEKWKNICVVGDASQSIYAWRGADFRNITNFQKDYPKCKIFHLEQNYRSTQIILDASFSVISKNTSHPILKLWTDKPSGSPVTVISATSEQYEANFVLQTIIQSKYQNQKLAFSDFAVLYRTNAQSRNMEEVFLHAGLPYILVGGVRFYARKEIKDVLSYLKLISNPLDKVSEKRMIKLGKKRFEEFKKFQKNYFDYPSHVKKVPTLDLLDNILQKTSYLDMYDKSDPEDQSRIENIKELRSVASEFPDLTVFLENVALVEQEHMPDRPLYFKEKTDAVTLMTLHAAKGLEFKTVFMIGMEEGLFPHSRSLLDRSEIEEERRLCYVGMTRAMDQLYLTHAKHRLYFGQRNSNQVSRFIEELPSELVNRTEYSPF
jgi:DNA helicase II / ATP-dependent DNA helicase PcrA